METHSIERTANAKALERHGACGWLSKVPSCGARLEHNLWSIYVKGSPRRFGLTFGAKIVFSDVLWTIGDGTWHICKPDKKATRNSLAQAVGTLDSA